MALPFSFLFPFLLFPFQNIIRCNYFHSGSSQFNEFGSLGSRLRQQAQSFYLSTSGKRGPVSSQLRPVGSAQKLNYTPTKTHRRRSFEVLCALMSTHRTENSGHAHLQVHGQTHLSPGSQTHVCSPLHIDHLWIQYDVLPHFVTITFVCS